MSCAFTAWGRCQTGLPPPLRPVLCQDLNPALRPLWRLAWRLAWRPAQGLAFHGLALLPALALALSPAAVSAAERLEPEVALRAPATAASGAQAALAQGLLGTRWRVKELLGAPLSASAGGARAPHLILDAAHLRLSGSGGCNRLMGSVGLDGQRIMFKRVVTTMMSCPQGMAQERSLIETLGQVQRWHMEDRHLMLMNWQQQVLVLLVRE